MKYEIPFGQPCLFYSFQQLVYNNNPSNSPLSRTSWVNRYRKNFTSSLPVFVFYRVSVAVLHVGMCATIVLCLHRNSTVNCQEG